MSTAPSRPGVVHDGGGMTLLDLRDYVVSPAKKGADGAYEAGSGQHVHVILDAVGYSR